MCFQCTKSIRRSFEMGEDGVQVLSTGYGRGPTELKVQRLSCATSVLPKRAKIARLEEKASSGWDAMLMMFSPIHHS